jgi:hypothetical protein
MFGSKSSASGTRRALPTRKGLGMLAGADARRQLSEGGYVTHEGMDRSRMGLTPDHSMADSAADTSSAGPKSKTGDPVLGGTNLSRVRPAPGDKSSPWTETCQGKIP